MSGKIPWKQGWMRSLRVRILIAAAVLPAIVFAIGKVTDFRNPFPMPRVLHHLAIFPFPVVFNDPAYLLQQEIILHGSADTKLELSDLVKRSYRGQHRFAGVTLWHFLKYSPLFSDEVVHDGLEAYFCADGKALDLVVFEDHLKSLEYTVRTTVAERKIVHQCKN